jgi:O-antigen ligase
VAGAWRGLTVQKNTLGAIAATSTILWVHAVLARQVSLLRALGGIGVSSACLFLSRSSTALLATLFVVPFMMPILRPPGPAVRRYMPYAIGLFSVLFITYSLAVLDIVPGLGVLLEPITAITGKDMSFSGRTAIWAIVKEEIARHPLLGIGYGAYWTGPVPGSPSYEFLSRLYFYPTESHNGYLEVVNEVGFVGGCCLIGYLVSYLRQSLRLLKFDRVHGSLFLALLFQEFIGNLSEAHWLNVSSVNFFILTLATVATARALVDIDQRAARPFAATGQAARARII